MSPAGKDFVQIKHEFDLLKGISIKGVVRPVTLEKSPNGLALILEDFEARPLAEVIHEKSLDLEDMLGISANLALILGELHRSNIIHKDLQPENIFINKDTCEVWLVDFSIASFLPRETPDISNPDIIEGTLAYMSPEQTGRMNRDVDYRTDFYSFGVTLYEMLTGQLPFQNTDPLELVHCHLARQPSPLFHLNSDIPDVISNLVLKLLAKTAEERYRSAWGLKADLAECLRQLRATKRIEPFQLATKDISDKFRISQKLYGREQEIEILLKLFDNVGEGASELVIVAGYSGVGKTSLVKEVYKPITEKKGYFISGKFNQFHRSVPYSALVAAFQDLTHQILTESERQLSFWKERLLKALGFNGRIIIDVIPEVELIIGPQPAVKELGSDEAHNRFIRVFLNFVRAFCREDHPLVIFLDDLQWVDTATLNLLELMMVDDEMSYLFLIGAYRDNEVSPVHPLMISVDTLQKQNVYPHRITLTPLNLEHISAMVADTLNSNESITKPLAEIIANKTGGNPFFVNQFLTMLHQEKLLRLSGESTSWVWNQAEVESLGITDNVVDLLIYRLRHMPPETQEALQMAACIGNRFDLNTLSLITGNFPQDTLKCLMPALQEELIVSTLRLRSSGAKEMSGPLHIESFRFQHDRVHQAAYAIINKAERKPIHVQIGRVLLESSETNKLEEEIFDVITHLNFGAEFIDGHTERLELAELNLIAGRKARGSAAFEPAFDFFKTGIDLLPEDYWQSQYKLALNLYVECLEAARLSGNYKEMEHYYESVRQNAESLLDVIGMYQSRIRACMAQNKLSEALNTAREILDYLGENITENPTESKAQTAIQETMSVLGDRQIEDLVNLPKMTDPMKLAAVRILVDVTSAVYIGAPQMSAFFICKQVDLSINYGNTEDAAFSYSAFGALLCKLGEDIESGYRFGQLGIALLRRFNIKEFEAKVYHAVSTYISHWKDPIRNTMELALEGYRSGIEAGDFEFAGYNVYCRSKHSLLAGKQLNTISEEMALYGNAIRKLKQETPYHFNQIFRQTALNLMGKCDDPTLLIGEAYDEREMLPLHHRANDRLALMYFNFSKLMICYLFGSFPKAVACADLAEKELLILPGGPLAYSVFHFYDSLARLALCDTCPETELGLYMAKAVENQKKLKVWGSHAPSNYLHKFQLVEAELCRINGKHEEAIDHYDRAIELAKENDYVNEEALAYELAAKFWLSKGKHEFAGPFIQKAYTCYLRWGAVKKAALIEKEYPQLLADIRADSEPFVPETLTADTTGKQSSSAGLDLATIMKASQAISSEILLDKLLITLMRHVIENAGAERGSLIMEVDGELKLAAQGDAKGYESTFQPYLSLEEGEYLSPAIVNYVARTRENVVLDNALQEGIFTGDPYVQSQRLKSVLCIPILNKFRLSVILYLENRLIPSVFSTDRLEMLKVLASQIAISIENARLYDDRKKAEEEYRSIFENAVEGIFQSTVQGHFISVNPAMARILGYESPEELIRTVIDVSNQLYVNPADRKELIANLQNRKGVKGFELQFLRKDGSRMWASLHVRPVYDDAGNLKIIEGFFADITERRRETDALRDREEFLRKENIRLKSNIKDRYKFGNIIGKSQAMQMVYELVLKAAASDANVIIYGESGTGKELVAKAVHDLSDRKSKRFAPVNCGALPENLVESEFFGYKKGAFTGAGGDKEGYMDLADGGTLFLDELGEIDLNIQVKLLRVLEGGGFTPVGGRDVRKPDVRVIAATNRELQELVRKGMMREDFFYRIHIIPLHLPPLRERKEDIPLLIEHFTQSYGDNKEIPVLTGEMLEALLRYEWPGNVRELHNVLHRFFTLNKLDLIDSPPGEMPQFKDIAATVLKAENNIYQAAISDFEKTLLTRVLEQHQWHRERAAASLGIPLRTFFRKLKKYGLVRHN